MMTAWNWRYQRTQKSWYTPSSYLLFIRYMCLLILTSYTSGNPIVRVEQGSLEGELLDVVTKDGQYYSFKGIPYAEPPIGNLRFKAPNPPLPWRGLKKCIEHGPVCPQLNIYTNIYTPGNEDCLYLNVYSPNLTPNKPLSVMVFIHGGAFIFGSGNVDDYGPDFLVNHGVVLVTLNYRLGALGFLCLDIKEVPGNAGLKDQVAALKWVKRNIKQFGGDPDNITLFGQSAGAASVAYHTLSKMSKGLFKRAISMSGVPFCDWAIPFLPRRRAFTLGKQLGINTDNPYILLKFFQNSTVDQLIKSNPFLLIIEETRNVIKTYPFTPVIEKPFGQNIFIDENPEQMLKKGKIINDVDILFGHTSEEGLVGINIYENITIPYYNKYPENITPRKIAIKSIPEDVLKVSDKIHTHFFGQKPIDLNIMKEFVTYISESTFIYDIYRYMRLVSKVGCFKRYFYIFSCVSERNIYSGAGGKYGLTGAGHLDDIMYLFDPKSIGLPIEKTDRSYRLVQQQCEIFSNFAKYGNPTPDNSLGVIWPEYDAKTQKYVNISDTLTVANLDKSITAFWKCIYDSVHLPF